MKKLFVNAKIYTLDDNMSIADAMCVFDDKIAGTGTAGQLIKEYPDAQIIDLGGAAVIPGLIDSHCHFATAFDSEANGEIFIPTNIPDLLADVAKKAASLAPGRVIYYPNTYPIRIDGGYPTLEQLDKAAPNHPVCVCGFYSMAVNSAFLKANDITKDTQNPAGGMIMKSPDGQPTGLLLNCLNYLPEKPFSLDPEQKTEVLIRGMEAYNRAGITTALDAGTDPFFLQSMKTIIDENRQTVRVRCTLMLNGHDDRQMLDFKQRFDGVSEQYLKPVNCKTLVDGGILTGTSYMNRPYEKTMAAFGFQLENWRGLVTKDVEQLKAQIALAQRHRLSYTAHCVGSAAAHLLLDAYSETALDPALSHSITHGDFLSKDMLEQMRGLGIGLLFQPAWHYMDACALEETVAPEEYATFMPYCDILNSGILAGAGSDHMAKFDKNLSQNPYNPFLGLYNMVSGKNRTGGKPACAQTISRNDALLYYTKKAADMTFDREYLGSLEPGKFADFLVLDRDYFTCQEEEIKDITPAMTFFGGTRV